MTDRHTGPPLDMRAACREMLGEQWSVPLAYMLGISPRSLQRMAAGQNAIPPPILNHVAEMLSVCRAIRKNVRSDSANFAGMELRAAGDELFGTWWQTPLSNLFDISARRIELMASGDEPIHASVTHVLVPVLLAIARSSRADAELARIQRAAAE